MKRVNITGASGSVSAYVISELQEEGKPSLVLVSGRSRAEKLAADLSFFSDRNIYIMPPAEEVFFTYDARNNDAELERASCLKRLIEDVDPVVIVPASAAVMKLPAPSLFLEKTIEIDIGNDIDLDAFKSALIDMGYERHDYSEFPGRFSVRGGIIDVYPMDAENPYRIELFDTVVDGIREFDAESQRSIKELNKIRISPAGVLTDKGIRTYIKDGGASFYIWDYVKDGSIFVDDLERILEHIDLLEQETMNDYEIMLEKGQVDKDDELLIATAKDLEPLYNQDNIYFLQPFPKAYREDIFLTDNTSVKTRPVMSYNGHLDVLSKDISMYREEGYRVIISAASSGRESALREYIRDNGFDSFVDVKKGTLSSGIILPAEKVCYISEGNIFNETRVARRRKHKRGKRLEAFAELKPGDFVVHENHGIGVFMAIEPYKNQGQVRDYIKIKYAGNGMLYVPVEQMDVVQKYIGSEGQTPRLNKLGGNEWKRIKSRAREAVKEMTDELVQLYARRKNESGYAFSEDTVWQQEFENDFPYDETEDQLRSIEEIKKDMEDSEPMDRLLCGDVGYGKTEVAARAIFKCLIEGKQAAFLVPTTILASQHFETLKERFKKYPFTIEMLSRFKSDKEQEEIISALGKGKVDLIIGTHRLLSQDIKFNDLGLLVVDEEQRFGVAHKEKIKSLKAGVDVLTLSATPIPRTLNMSLTGIRDMSLITEPPEERYPVHTYVLEQDDLLIREVINRELDRGGQVFLVFNRVRGILSIAEKIRSLVPDAEVQVAHGQMSERSLEEVMKNFIAGDVQVLVATTIIESGLDIPNANTLIVLDADRCGLAQLYQLRGRVGRSNRMAYAYLMYKKDKVLSEISEKRLRAIREFTEFGAGFKIAMRDMELRGAGNILGAEQSGHMLNVGYEMYVRLVDEAAREARGETLPLRRDATSVELKCAANIPSWYIDNEVVKLSMYKRIADIDSMEEMRDCFDELLDRFGPIPKETENLLKISLIRALSTSLAIERVYEHNGKINIILSKDTNITPYDIFGITEKYGKRVFFHEGRESYFAFSNKQNDFPEDKLEMTIGILAILKEGQKTAQNMGKQ